MRRCQLLFLQPTMVGRITWITKRWINTKLQFCCSYNLEAYYRIYLRLISVSFLHFQSLLCFMKSHFGGVTSSFLMKSPFSQNQIFNKKWNTYVNSTPFVADITLITLYQIYINKRANIFSKFLFINATKRIFQVTLCQVCLKLNKY